MYSKTFAWARLTWSETRFYMAFVVGAAMTMIMLSFMLGMYSNKPMNIGIYALAGLVFIGALWLVLSQTSVEDRSWVSAMIPHHSIAILISESANIEDLRVRELADEIIEAQHREIEEVQWVDRRYQDK